MSESSPNNYTASQLLLVEDTKNSNITPSDELTSSTRCILCVTYKRYQGPVLPCLVFAVSLVFAFGHAASRIIGRAAQASHAIIYTLDKTASHFIAHGTCVAQKWDASLGRGEDGGGGACGLMGYMIRLEVPVLDHEQRLLFVYRKWPNIVRQSVNCQGASMHPPERFTCALRHKRRGGDGGDGVLR